MTTTHYAKNSLPLPVSQLPKPILEDRPDLIELYWKAWEYAWDHVIDNPDFPHSPYLDEAFQPDLIWIWDSCFMVLFARYAPKVFPPANTLDNFYAMMLDGVQAPLKIHHPDNPPLFAWAERELFRMTGDTDRVRRILLEKKYLQRQFAAFDAFLPGTRPDWANCDVALQKDALGYRWSGCPNGMDNTPRGDFDYESIYWLDALAQQALSALCIMELADLIDATELAEAYRAIHADLCLQLNQHYWHEADQFYYDLLIDQPGTHSRIKTPAAYWPLLAGAADASQAAALARAAEDAQTFGGSVPFPAVARDSQYYEPKGLYMQSGVWLPMVYLGCKALEQNGHRGAADAAATKMLDHMAHTYAEFEPPTIWENYAPEAPAPATTKNNIDISRPDFCGWSALGPISLFIENTLGFHTVDAARRTLHWKLGQTGRHGLENLSFGDITTSILYEDDHVKVESNGEFTLIINGSAHAIRAGANSLSV